MFDQLTDNIGATNLELDRRDVEELDKLTEVTPGYPAWMQSMERDQKISDGPGPCIGRQRYEA
jgi:hypothetical protein